MDKTYYVVVIKFGNDSRPRVYVRNVWKDEAAVHAAIAKQQGHRDVRILTMAQWREEERVKRGGKEAAARLAEDAEATGRGEVSEGLACDPAG